MLRKHIVAGALLLMLGVAAAASKKQDSTALGFGQWLDQVKAKSTASSKAGPSSVAPAYEYDEVEVHHTCLEDIKQQNCVPQVNSSPGYFESLFTCCGEKSKSNELVLEPTAIGQCDFRYFVLPAFVDVATNVQRFLNFMALCHFEKQAEECGEPFCDKMVISIRAGAGYRIDDAIISSVPSPPTFVGACNDKRRLAGNVTEQLSGRNGRHSPKVTAKAAYEPHYEAPGYYEGPDYNYPTKTLYKASFATVFYGPFTVNSRSHNVKYDQGWFEYVNYIDESVPATESEAHDAHVLDPYKYKLSFIKNKSY